MDQFMVKTGLSNLTKGGQPCFQLYGKNIVPMGQEEFVKRLAERLGKSPAEARFINDVHGQVFCQALIENKAVNTGCLRGYLTALGSVESAGAPLSKEKNPIKAVILPHGELKAALDGVVAVNDTQVIEAILYTIKYSQSRRINTIEGLEVVKANGVGLILNLQNEDEGIWLEDSSGTMVSDKALVDSNDTNTINFRFAALPENGRYNLVIATRNGESKDDYGIVRLTRQVIVDVA